MAYDKIIPIRRRLDHCVDYALNEAKTSLSAALGYIGNEDKPPSPAVTCWKRRSTASWGRRIRT